VVHLRLSDNSPIFDPLVPVTLAKYLSRNPNLISFVVSSRTGRIRGQIPENFRSSPAFTKTDSLLAQLAACRNLTAIVIDGIPFPPGDIITQMLQVLQGSPNMITFRFLPVAVSSAAFVETSIACLRDISVRCTNLVELAIPVDLWDMKTLSIPAKIHEGVSKMRKLYLVPTSGEFPPYTVEHSAHVAKYLYHLFPHLTPIASLCKQGDEVERAF
jgi:hypothetical protein